MDHDFVAAGALCADHLADLGHREIALIGYGLGVYHRHAGYAERTLTGFRERAGERGLRFVHRPCEGTYESTAGTLARILADRPGTTGFVVQNEGAIGPLLSLLRASGRTVPEDASVIALCTEQLAELHAPGSPPSPDRRRNSAGSRSSRSCAGSRRWRVANARWTNWCCSPRS
ncbi:hypothetical protein GCM10029964_063810 [Kibdelosporangium lantanae]